MQTENKNIVRIKIDSNIRLSQYGPIIAITSIGEGNGAFLLRVWKPLPSRHVLISASNGLGLLQLVSEPDIRQRERGC